MAGVSLPPRRPPAAKSFYRSGAKLSSGKPADSAGGS